MPITGCSSEAVTWNVKVKQPDLHEVEPVAVLEDRIDRRQQRLHDVIDEVADGDGEDDGKGGLLCGLGEGEGGCRHGKSNGEYRSPLRPRF